MGGGGGGVGSAQHSFASSGRGGAGNFVDSAKSPRIGPKDLETPTLKNSVVTTGRGGSGNMMPNKDPAETRAMQDVKAVPRRPSQGATHIGRGGEGNVVFKPDTDEEAKAARDARAGGDSAVITEDPNEEEQHNVAPAKKAAEKAEGLAAKGKHLFTGKKE